MSGNCATGSARRAITPAIEITTEITIASLGRWMKTDEIIEGTLPLVSRPGPGRAGALRSFLPGCAAVLEPQRAPLALRLPRPQRAPRGGYRGEGVAARLCRPGRRHRRKGLCG